MSIDHALVLAANLEIAAALWRGLCHLPYTGGGGGLGHLVIVGRRTVTADHTFTAPATQGPPKDPQGPWRAPRAYTPQPAK